MTRILVIHANLELGGAETSLLGLLNSFDYTNTAVDLFLYERRGELLSLVPETVNVLPEIPAYRALVSPITAAAKSFKLGVVLARVRAKQKFKSRNKKYHFTDAGYVQKQWTHKYALPSLPMLPGEYDVAISFNDPHFILAKKANARVKIGWFHTDFVRITPDDAIENEMWSGCDRIVNVSEACRQHFDEKHPTLADRSIVMENILSARFIERQKSAIDPEREMPRDGSIRILSVGRFCEAKNFDNVPDICSRLLAGGLDVKWYLIGYGSDEDKIREAITVAGMEERVIILGKKENPYPYVAACDLYAQPSRYEGKSVTVREAQMLCRPVVITRYATSASQLEDGADGVVVPMDNQGCADGIAALLRDPERMRRLSECCRSRDYSNAAEVQKIYQLTE